jgi:hypothetical protein
MEKCKHKPYISRFLTYEIDMHMSFSGSANFLETVLELSFCQNIKKLGYLIKKFKNI